MKRSLLLWAMTAALCLLAGCGGGREFYGRVVERAAGADGSPAFLVLETEGGRRMGVLITGETSVVPSGDAADAAAQLLESDGARVLAVCQGPRRSLTAADGEKLAAYDAARVRVEEILTRGAVTLADGTAVDVWRGSFSNSYELEDGTGLLREQCSFGPENVSVGGLAGYEDLSEAAQPKVSAYFADQGLLYDAQEELERAYAAYLEQGAGTGFRSHSVGQDISPTASNDRILCFLTNVTLPVHGDICTELRLGTVFDRETGERIPPWDLFACGREEAVRAVLDAADVTPPDLRRELEAAFDPENLVFFPDHLEVSFPAGSLPSQEHAYLVGVEYEALRGVLHDWAIPEDSNAENNP